MHSISSRHLEYLYVHCTVREETPGRHEPLLCRHEPPRFARQTEPLLCCNEHAQYIKMYRVIQEVLLNLCFKFLKKDFFFTNFSTIDEKYLSIITKSA